MIFFYLLRHFTPQRTNKYFTVKYQLYILEKWFITVIITGTLSFLTYFCTCFLLLLWPHWNLISLDIWTISTTLIIIDRFICYKSIGIKSFIKNDFLKCMYMRGFIYLFPKGSCQFKHVIGLQHFFLFCSLFIMDFYKDFLFLVCFRNQEWMLNFVLISIDLSIGIFSFTASLINTAYFSFVVLLLN